MTKTKGRSVPTPPAEQAEQTGEPPQHPRTLDELLARLEFELKAQKEQLTNELANANIRIGQVQGAIAANEATIARLKGLDPPAPAEDRRILPDSDAAAQVEDDG